MFHIDPARRRAAQTSPGKPGAGNAVKAGVIRDRSPEGLARAGFGFDEPDLKAQRFWAGLFVIAGTVGFLLVLLWGLALVGAGPSPLPAFLWAVAALSPLYWIPRLPRRMMWNREAVAFDAGGGVWFNAPGRRPGQPLELHRSEKIDGGQIVNIEARHWPERRPQLRFTDSYRSMPWGASSIEYDIRAILDTGEAFVLSVGHSEESARVIVRQLSLALGEVRGGVGFGE